MTLRLKGLTNHSGNHNHDCITHNNVLLVYVYVLCVCLVLTFCACREREKVDIIENYKIIQDNMIVGLCAGLHANK